MYNTVAAPNQTRKRPFKRKPLKNTNFWLTCVSLELFEQGALVLNREELGGCGCGERGAGSGLGAGRGGAIHLMFVSQSFTKLSLALVRKFNSEETFISTMRMHSFQKQDKTEPSMLNCIHLIYLKKKTFIA
jgi:hypothetical protein